MRAVLIFIVLLVASCANSTTPDLPGNPAVYVDIEAETDCSALQEAFDQASENFDLVEPGTEQSSWSVGYMTAADERMASIGCYE